MNAGTAISVPDPGDDGEPEVGVRDRHEVRRAGSLLDRPAAVVQAAIEFGLEQSAAGSALHVDFWAWEATAHHQLVRALTACS